MARFSAEQKIDLWRRWRDGQSMSDISRALQCQTPAIIFSEICRTGGFSPLSRRRSKLHLSLSEREQISRGIASGESIRSIARALSRSASTISREIQRNSGRLGYRAVGAENRAWECGKRPKICKLAKYPKLCDVVAKKLALNWSPQQIAGHLRSRAERKSVSHVTIYKSLFVQARNVLKRELCDHLRTGRLYRRGRNRSDKRQSGGGIIGAISISERPAEVEDRAVPGHWEGDLICGAGSYIATLVERHSRYVMLVRVPGKDTKSVVQGLTREIKKLPAHLRRSLTWDRGTEMAHHANFTVATNVDVYFCDPHSPWQRGSNENTNGLLRQYFPKATPLGHFTQPQLNRVARELNERPRQTLNWKTPAEVINALLH